MQLNAETNSKMGVYINTLGMANAITPVNSIRRIMGLPISMPINEKGGFGTT